MLGDLLLEASGPVGGVRLLPLEDGRSSVEVSFQGPAALLGEEVLHICTFRQTVRPGGSLYGEGDVLMLTPEGTAHWKGYGVGRPQGRPPATRYRTVGIFHTAPPSHERLLTVATVVEFEVDEDNQFAWQMWEWK